MAVGVQQISHITICHIAISLHAKLLLIQMATTYMQLEIRSSLFWGVTQR